eukprot:TRINITY_DN2446_c0_g1_i2.p1 TRINITY_DN2446_c0_g1~~TRINITY_DN2446_c0_g1_i2.p1  ORF type:complete len:724 (-),score=124.84 TRINITY_DN2446_c0_g1_i2:87-2258(-)
MTSISARLDHAHGRPPIPFTPLHVKQDFAKHAVPTSCMLPHLTDMEVVVPSFSFPQLMKGLEEVFDRMRLDIQSLQIECYHLRQASSGKHTPSDWTHLPPFENFDQDEVPNGKKGVMLVTTPRRPTEPIFDESQASPLPLMLLEAQMHETSESVEGVPPPRVALSPPVPSPSNGCAELPMKPGPLIHESTAVTAASSKEQDLCMSDVTLDLSRLPRSPSDPSRSNECEDDRFSKFSCYEQTDIHHKNSVDGSEQGLSCTKSLQSKKSMQPAWERGDPPPFEERQNASCRRVGPTKVDERNHWRVFVSKLLRHPAFDQCIGVVILIDGCLLGLQAQDASVPMLAKSTKQIFEVIVYLLRGIFMVELMLRFFGDTVRGALQSAWTRFDSILVVFSVVEIILGSMDQKLGPITILRIFRLARLARAARLMIQFRTLWLLVSGLRASFMTVMWTFVLILSIGFIFAIVGMEVIPLRTASSVRPIPILYEESGEIDDFSTNYQRVALKNFGSMDDALLTLLQILTLDSIAAIYRPLVMESPSGIGWFNIFYFLGYIFFVSIALMNLVTAVMVEGALQQANADRDSARAHEEQRKRNLMPKLRDMFMTLDEDGSGEVSMQEIENAPKSLTDELKNITHTEDLTEIFALLDDDDSGSVQVDEFLEGIFKASKGDVMTKLQLARLVRQMGMMKNYMERLSPLVVPVPMRHANSAPPTGTPFSETRLGNSPG